MLAVAVRPERGGSLRADSPTKNVRAEKNVRAIPLLARLTKSLVEPRTTDADGRFAIRGLIPVLKASSSFREPPPTPFQIGPGQVYQPDSLRSLDLRDGETRDLGDLRIRTRKP